MIVRAILAGHVDGRFLLGCEPDHSEKTAAVLLDSGSREAACPQVPLAEFRMIKEERDPLTG
jgi:hypothetical protein